MKQISVFKRYMTAGILTAVSLMSAGLLACTKQQGETEAVATSGAEDATEPEGHPQDVPMKLLYLSADREEDRDEAQEGTKTFIDGTEVKWEIGDSLSVFTSVNTEPQEFKMKDDCKEAVRGGSTSASFRGLVAASAEKVWAVYPHDVNARLVKENQLKIVLPQVQYAGAHGTSTSMLMVGTASIVEGDIPNGALSVSNVCGRVAVTITRDDVTAVTVNGKNLAGTAQVSVQNGEILSLDEGFSSVTLYPREGLSVFAPGTYQIAVLPGMTPAEAFSVSLSVSADCGGTSVPAVATATIAKSVSIPRKSGVKFTDTSLIGAVSSAWTYYIGTAEQLVGWNVSRTEGDADANNNMTVRLTADIDMSGKAWTPKDFRGTFDGADPVSGDARRIYNFTLTSNLQNVGLFATMLGSATVRNLVFGAAPGQDVWDGQSAISYTGTEDGRWNNVGSICGVMEGTSRIEGVTNYASVTVASSCSAKTCLGGIAGMVSQDVLSGKIERCINRGTLTHNGTSATTNQMIGGIAGSIERCTLLSSCRNEAEIVNACPGVRLMGGISACTNGEAWVGTERTAALSELTDCVNAGAITASGGTSDLYIGGIVGAHTGGTLTDCVNESTGILTSTKSSGHVYKGGIAARSGRQTGNFNETASFVRCRNEADITADNAYTDRMGGILAYATIAAAANTSPAVLSMTGCENNGDISNTSTGTVNQTYMGGLIGHYEGKNGYAFIVRDCVNRGMITCTTPGLNASYIGGLCGRATYMTLSGVVNQGAIDVSRDVASKTPNVGGLMGYAQHSTVRSSSNTANITASTTGGSALLNVGGFFGNCENDVSVQGTSASPCVNSGDIDGSNKNAHLSIGGISGRVSNGTVSFEHVLNTGKVHGHQTVRTSSSETRIGGVVGYQLGGTVSYTRCENSGEIYADMGGYGIFVNVGGVIGCIAQDSGSVTVSGLNNSGPVHSDAELDQVDANARIGGLIGFCNRLTWGGTCQNSGRVFTEAATMTNVGGIVGVAKGSFEIGAPGRPVLNTGSIESSKCKIVAGGIVGAVDTGDSGSIRFATNRGPLDLTVTSGQARVGGIVGSLRNADNTTSLTVNHCVNQADVACSSTAGVVSSSVGGVAAYASGSEGNPVFIEDCLNTGAVRLTAHSDVDNQLACCGGIVGCLRCYCTLQGNVNGRPEASSDGSVSCTNSAGTAFAGGIFAGDYFPELDGEASVSYNTVAANYNFAPVSATAAAGATQAGAGGLAGILRKSGTYTTTANYNDGNVTCTSIASAGAVLGRDEADNSIEAVVSQSVRVTNGATSLTYASVKESAADLLNWLCPSRSSGTSVSVTYPALAEDGTTSFTPGSITLPSTPLF